MALTGNIDRLNNRELVGWVLDLADETRRIALDVVVNGRRLDVRTDISRPDVALRFGNQFANSGFSTDLFGVKLGSINSLTVLCDGQVLPFDGYQPHFFAIGEERAAVRSHLENQGVFRFPSTFTKEVPQAFAASTDESRARLAEAVLELNLVFVLFSNRSGSNLITDMLEQAGLGLGTTNEPLLPEVMLDAARGFPELTIEDYLVETLNTWRDGSYCFIKMGWDTLSYFISSCILPGKIAASPIIWTGRRNKVAQAISYVKAHLRGTYFSRVAEMDNQRPKSWGELWCGDVHLSAILGEMHNFYVADYRIGYICDLFSLKPLCLQYEDIASDLSGTFNRVTSFVGSYFDVPNARTEYRPQLLKQAASNDLDLEIAIRNALRNNI